MSQIASLTQASANYVWQGQPTTTLNFTHNGLNQDAAIATLNATAAPGYDPNGNLTDTGIRNYTYNADNRMAFTGNAVTALGIAYDPLGRLRATHNSANAYTYFLYVGDQLIGEYADKAAGQAPLYRYVHADGVDEPVAWYVGADTTQRRWFHADRQGSIIAWSDVYGAVQHTWTYSPYGEPSDWTGSRFMYTGQVALPEFQAYFYKARIYDPAMGRFLQTDPIGQKDDANLYGYVEDDPTDQTDPTGNAAAGGYFGGAGEIGIVAAGAAYQHSISVVRWLDGNRVAVYSTRGGFAGGPGWGAAYPNPPTGSTFSNTRGGTVLGAGFGVGFGGLLTNSKEPRDLVGDSNQWNISIAIFGGSVSKSGDIYQLIYGISRSWGATLSNYQTTSKLLGVLTGSVGEKGSQPLVRVTVNKDGSVTGTYAAATGSKVQPTITVRPDDQKTK